MTSPWARRRDFRGKEDKRGMAESMHTYEMIIIAVPELDDQALTAFNERVSGWVKAGGGTEPQINVWGRRRLTYAIRKHTDGIYVQYNYQMRPQGTRELDRNLKIDEQVVRHLVIRLDE
jgi:small subunit ribosomal protein S6